MNNQEKPTKPDKSEINPRLSEQLMLLFLLSNLLMYFLVPAYREKTHKIVDTINSQVASTITQAFSSRLDNIRQGRLPTLQERNVLEPYPLSSSDVGKLAVIKNYVVISSKEKKFVSTDKRVIKIVKIKAILGNAIYFEGATVSASMDGTYTIDPETQLYNNFQISDILPDNFFRSPAD